MNKNTEIIQAKLVTGQEIICQVLDQDSEELWDSYTVRHVMEFVAGVDQQGREGWMLQPYMIYQNAPHQQQLLREAHIVMVAKPNQDVIEQYLMFVKAFVERAYENQSGDDDIDVIDTIESKAGDADQQDYSVDSDMVNIIKLFPGNDKMH